jgi:hypothetical protein
MNSSCKIHCRLITLMVTAVLVVLMTAWTARTHCDTEDGPIIPQIRASLDSGDITPLLKWLRPDDEQEIRDLFVRVRAIRSRSEEAREIGDRLFIETFIRLHRAGEGAGFTGIKPTGTTAPIFAELDEALESGSAEALADKIAAEVRASIVTRFDRALELSKHQDESVEAGREFVEAYITYMHFVEGLHGYLTAEAPSHHSATEEAHGH